MTAWNQISAKQKGFIVFWAILIVAIYAASTIPTLVALEGVKIESAARHAARLHPTQTEAGLTQPDPFPETGDFTPVFIGTYVDRIEDLSIRESSWNVDFYVWFRWKGDKDLNPGSTFKVIDGKIEEKNLEQEYFGPDGTNYQKYRVYAHITKFFDTRRFPLDDHMLNIFIEDGSRDGSQLRYVVDPKASGLSSRVKIPGYRITTVGEVSKPHTYKSSLGDPRIKQDTHATFSQYVLGISINRPGFGFYFKIFVALFAAIAIALTALFIKPTDVDPRFGLAAGAFFGAVANTYLANSLLPDTGVFGLIDQVNTIGLVTIFVVVAESTLSLFIYDRMGDEHFSKALDIVSVSTILPIYILANVVIPFKVYLF